MVLGAGLTGLAAARQLTETGIPATVIEQHGEPGGACRTVEQDGFVFDYTGHLLHVRQPESRALLASVGALRGFRGHRRRAGVCLAGVVTPYPVQIHTHRLPRHMRRDCVAGFVAALLTGTSPAPPEASFAEWVLTRFGEGLARHFFFPYNRKLFLAEPEQYSAEWTGRFVPRPEIRDVLDGAFGLHRGAVGYNATFLYPRRGGIRLVADALAADLPGLRLGHRVRSLCLADRQVELDSGEILDFDVLIATVDLPGLAALTVDLPLAARRAAAGLRAVDVVNLNFGVRGPAPRREHWLYVPEPQLPFYRVGLPSNHGQLAPPGCHTISVEVSLPVGAAPAENLQTRCLAGLQTLGLLRDQADICTSLKLRLSPAYVVFDWQRQQALETLAAPFAAAGVIRAGRWAEWTYAAMEDALLAGSRAARSVTACAR